MTKAVLWHATWRDTHEPRVRELAAACGGTAQDVATTPNTIAGLDTLIFWGHGTPQNFCDLDAQQFVERVAEWKKKNKDLDIVEIITCNARHGNRGAPDSFTRQVAREITKKIDNIQFRALPVATSKKGDVCNWSILLWHQPTKTWAYVAAPDYKGPVGSDAANSELPKQSDSNTDYWMSRAEQLLKHFHKNSLTEQPNDLGFQRASVKLNKFHGYPPDHPYVKKEGWDKHKIKKWNQDAKLTLKMSYIIAGNINTLRWCLGEIR